jgi:mannose-6-phosphate isomerase-like protein (cupin superfamily)
MTLSARAADLLRRIPGAASPAWPQGQRFAAAFAHGTMSVELYAPVDVDPQTPHLQDELYVIHAGTATLVLAGERVDCTPGSVVFVAAGASHHFESFSKDFSTWVVFWGPSGGESGGSGP